MTPKLPSNGGSDENIKQIELQIKINVGLYLEL